MPIMEKYPEDERIWHYYLQRKIYTNLVVFVVVVVVVAVVVVVEMRI